MGETDGNFEDKRVTAFLRKICSLYIYDKFSYQAVMNFRFASQSY